MRWWEELSGPLLGRYRVERLLGQGGMAEVLLARDERFEGKRVAIKAPTLDSFAPKQLAELMLRFQREVQRQGSESIAGVVPIFDAGEVTDSRGNSQPFLVMDYLSGGSLGDKLGGNSGRRERTQTLGEVLEWLRPVATTLDRLHARKYLHRDVKPDNILFNADGDPFLSDFGIATSLEDVTGAGTMMSVMGSAGPGSPGYQSPESLRGDKLAASDQFSLAVTAYEALAGRLPMNASTRDGWIGALANWKPTPISEVCPELPSAAAEVLMRALSLEPRDRYLSCAAFAQALAEAIVAPRAQPAPVAPVIAAAPPAAPPGPRPAPPAEAKSLFARTWFRWVAGLSMLLLVAILGFFGFVWWAVQPELRNDALRDEGAKAEAEPSFGTLAVQAHSAGPEADAKELEAAALSAQKLDVAFTAASEQARIEARLERALEAGRQGLDSARAAEKLAALAANFMDHYEQRGVTLLGYSQDLAERATKAMRSSPFSDDARLKALAKDAEAAFKRITAEVARRNEQGLAGAAAGPTGSDDIIARVTRGGGFGTRFAEVRSLAADQGATAESCDTEIRLEAEKQFGLRRTRFSGCPGSRRIFQASEDFNPVRANDKDTLVFDTLNAESDCRVNDGSICPGFRKDTPPQLTGTLELATDDLLVLATSPSDDPVVTTYTLMTRSAPKAASAEPVKPRATATAKAEHATAGEVMSDLCSVRKGSLLNPLCPPSGKPASPR